MVALPDTIRFRGRQALSVARLRSNHPSVSAAVERLVREGCSGPTGTAPVFVLGGGWRTGSTLLQRILNSAPGMLVWGEPFSEGAVLQRLAESLLFLDPQAGRFHGQVLADDEATPPRDIWTANLTPPVRHLVAAQRTMIDRLFAEPALRHGCARWGIKEVVWNGDVIELLRLLYPDARFLLLVRNPLTQWQSYRPVTRNPWFYRWPNRPIGSPASFARLWNHLAIDFVAAAQAPHTKLVRYETLGKQEVLDEVAAFAGIESSLSPEKEEEKVGSSSDRRYYRTNVPQWETRTIRRLTRQGATLLGYR